jgi:hypothetical protein
MLITLSAAANNKKIAVFSTGIPDCHSLTTSGGSGICNSLKRPQQGIVSAAPCPAMDTASATSHFKNINFLKLLQQPYMRHRRNPSADHSDNTDEYISKLII